MAEEEITITPSGRFRRKGAPHLFSRILIANRGEIALRILRACRELDIDAICVYSEADRDAAYLRYADESICIGPAASNMSYLDIPRLVSAAEIADVEAIHPGYGFLAENAHFAEICRSCHIEFIGPSVRSIDLMGNKSQARELARKSGVPVVPGSEGTVDNKDDALEIAHEIGFPVIIKASAGGGGRGMRVAHNDVSFVNAFQAAQAEAEIAFGDPALYMERYIEKARHVEIQVIADRHGNIVHLGERDCTIQRRHQKLVEEAPSPVLDEELRKKMGEAAVALTDAVNYENAGTVEFLVDAATNEFFFMEMNTRIQVEHPVTEMVTGIDLVAEQIRVASGFPLSFKQEEVTFDGWSFECRINAEDPDRQFKPCPGVIERYITPGGLGVRVDSHAYSGYMISPHYDSLIGKLIVHRPSRKEAIHAMRNALREYVIEGKSIRTTIPFHLELLRNADFINGDYNTKFVEEEMQD